MSFNGLVANTVNVGRQPQRGNIQMGINTTDENLVNFIQFEGPADVVTLSNSDAKVMAPVTHSATIGYDTNNQQFNINVAGGANMLLQNQSSLQTIETLAYSNLMTAGVNLEIQTGALGGPASSLVITDATDGHLISMDATGLKILPAGTTGLNGAVLTSDGFGNCSWVGGAFERLEALEKKVGIVPPVYERLKTGTGGPSKPRKIRVPK